MSTKSSTVRVNPRVFYDTGISQIMLDQRIIPMPRSRTGSVLPKYRQIIRDGGNATTNFTGTATHKYLMDDLTCRAAFMRPFGFPLNQQSLTQSTVTGSVTGKNFGNPLVWPNTANLREAEQKALTLVFKRLREDQQSISGPTFIGELRQTVGLIRGGARKLASSLTRYTSDLRKRKPKPGRGNWRDVKRNLAESWLDFSFGVQPLLNDIDGAALALARFSNEKTRRTRIRASGVSQVLDDITPMAASVGYADIAFRTQSSRSSVIHVIYHVGLQADLSWPEASANKLMTLTGFQLSEFVPTVWELLPWSFFIDYFSNIGDVISAGCTDLSRVAWAARTVRRTTDLQYSSVIDAAFMKASYGKDYLFSSMTGDAVVKFSTGTVDRSANYGIDYPSLSWGFPSSINQWANIAALKASCADLVPFFRPNRR